VASVRRRSGIEKRDATMAATTTAAISASSVVAMSRPVMVARVEARVVYGLARIVSTPHGSNSVLVLIGPKVVEAASRSRAWPGSGLAVKVAL